MKKIDYKLIISDYDGTLARKDGEVPQENINVINRYIENGGIFVISTGRLPGGIIEKAQRLGLNGLVSCCQGAIIVDIKTKKVVFDDRLSFETTLAACKKMEEMGLHIHAYDLWDYYCNMDDDALKHYEHITGTKANLVTDRLLSDFLKEKKLSAYKMLAMVWPEDNAKTVAELSAAGLPACQITKSSDFLVEVINPKYSKGSAVAFLAEHYGIDIKKTVAIGDNYNDLPMIEAAGVGAAVANAEQALKDKANYVCQNSNETAAVAEVIRKFGLGEQ